MSRKSAGSELELLTKAKPLNLLILRSTEIIGMLFSSGQAWPVIVASFVIIPMVRLPPEALAPLLTDVIGHLANWYGLGYTLFLLCACYCYYLKRRLHVTLGNGA